MNETIISEQLAIVDSHGTRRIVLRASGESPSLVITSPNGAMIKIGIESESAEPCIIVSGSQHLPGFTFRINPIDGSSELRIWCSNAKNSIALITGSEPENPQISFFSNGKLHATLPASKGSDF